MIKGTDNGDGNGGERCKLGNTVETENSRATLRQRAVAARAGGEITSSHYVMLITSAKLRNRLRNVGDVSNNDIK